MDRLARYLTDWLAGTDARLQRTSAQVRMNVGFGIEGSTLIAISQVSSSPFDSLRT